MEDPGAQFGKVLLRECVAEDCVLRSARHPVRQVPIGNTWCGPMHAGLKDPVKSVGNGLVQTPVCRVGTGQHVVQQGLVRILSCRGMPNGPIWGSQVSVTGRV